MEGFYVTRTHGNTVYQTWRHRFYLYALCYYFLYMTLSISRFLLLAALFFGALTIREVFLTIRMLRHGKRALGVVARLEADYDEGTPLITYRTYTGNEQTLRLSTRYWGETFVVGQHIPILYDSRRPAHAVVDRATHHWAGVILWLLLGLLALAVYEIAYTSAHLFSQ